MSRERERMREYNNNKYVSFFQVIFAVEKIFNDRTFSFSYLKGYTMTYL